MSLDIATLEHVTTQLKQDSDSIVSQITALNQQVGQAQNQLALLHGAREYNALALKRAQDTLALLQATVPTVVNPTS